MTVPMTASPTLSPRPHAERIRFELNEVRAELIYVAGAIPVEAFSLALSEEARSPREILKEIGVMEVLSRSAATRQEMPGWQATMDSLDGDTAAVVLDKLASVRAETLVYLDTVQETELEIPIPLPEGWSEYFGGATVIEPEELVRWICRHEYYHLGQLNTYNFIRAASK